MKINYEKRVQERRKCVSMAEKAAKYLQAEGELISLILAVKHILGPSFEMSQKIKYELLLFLTEGENE